VCLIGIFNDYAPACLSFASQVFIKEMQGLFDRNHKTCGAKDVQLRVM
jgi:hypothetical protein